MTMFRREKKNNWALINRVKYDGPCDGSPWLIYKYPEEDFVYGSQLVVNQGQEALFFKGGKALDLFGPGTHTLNTGNLPLFLFLTYIYTRSYIYSYMQIHAKISIG